MLNVGIFLEQIQLYWVWELFKKQTNTSVLNVGTVSQQTYTSVLNVGIVLETNKYKCVVCGNSFRNKLNLEVQHSGDKPCTVSF